MTSQIAFSSASSGDEDIYVMERDGSALRRLTYSSAGVSNRTPEWSPDKSRIAFQSSRDGENALYVIDVSTVEVRRLTKPGGNYRHPAWSPSGETILCINDMDASGALVFVDAADGAERRISPDGTGGRRLFNPCWVPATNRVAYVVQGAPDQSDALWTANLDGGDARRVGPSGLSIFEFDYSPDGALLVFDARISAASPLGDWDIFVMCSDGSEVRRLTELKAMSSRPKWTTGGEIVFHSNRFGDCLEQPSADASLKEWFSWWNQFEICTMEPGGMKVRRLTSNLLRDLHPDS